MAEPLANGIHVVGLARRLTPALVVVIGAGPLGLLCQQAFRKLSAADVVVVDRVAERLAVARRLGAKDVIHSGEEDVAGPRSRALTGGEGADVVVDAAGSAWTKAHAVKATRAGGMTVFLGLHENTIPFDSFDVTLAERTIQGSYCGVARGAGARRGSARARPRGRIELDQDVPAGRTAWRPSHGCSRPPPTTSRPCCSPPPAEPPPFSRDARTIIVAAPEDLGRSRARRTLLANGLISLVVTALFAGALEGAVPALPSRKAPSRRGRRSRSGRPRPRASTSTRCRRRTTAGRRGRSSTATGCAIGATR